ncbi:hypothetical protein RVIR1_08230 [Candidatus Rickettsiella viridis]|uniref:Uncharacterized protein n=1 Tax=Candidatus Rickettsiella viridis TaxID=676208 RepID=A0A2Z5V4E3_9COXI|nr:hypothetical protein RVIR1_08230 [Candidatus Rickettsiella viridis]
MRARSARGNLEIMTGWPRLLRKLAMTVNKNLNKKFWVSRRKAKSGL